MIEITDELIARYLEDAGDLSDDERKVAEQWANEHPDFVKMYNEAITAFENYEIDDESDTFNQPQTVVQKKNRLGQRFRIAASIVVLIGLGVVLARLLLPSNGRESMQAGMNPNEQTNWHSTEKIPQVWNVTTGDLLLEWESDAPHTRLEISTDGDNWTVYADDKSNCTIKYDSTLFEDTIIYWYLTFSYNDPQRCDNASGQIAIKK